MVAENNPATGQAQTITGREIVLTRRLDARRELVWRAWTEPEHLLRWGGPDGFTNTLQEFDLRPGGVWRFVMHGPDRTDYDNKIVFIEAVRPERLVFNHGAGDDDTAAGFQATVTFEADGDGTIVTLRSLFPTVEARDRAVKDYGAIEGGNQTLGRLAEYLRTM